MRRHFLTPAIIIIVVIFILLLIAHAFFATAHKQKHKYFYDIISYFENHKFDERTCIYTPDKAVVLNRAIDNTKIKYLYYFLDDYKLIIGINNTGEMVNHQILLR